MWGLKCGCPNPFLSNVGVQIPSKSFPRPPFVVCRLSRIMGKREEWVKSGRMKGGCPGSSGSLLGKWVEKWWRSGCPNPPPHPPRPADIRTSGESGRKSGCPHPPIRRLKVGVHIRESGCPHPASTSGHIWTHPDIRHRHPAPHPAHLHIWHISGQDIRHTSGHTSGHIRVTAHIRPILRPSGSPGHSPVRPLGPLASREQTTPPWSCRRGRSLEEAV